MLNPLEYRVSYTFNKPHTRMFQHGDAARRFANKQAEREAVSDVTMHVREVGWWTPVARIVDGYIEYHDIDPPEGVAYEYVVRYRRTTTGIKVRHFETEAEASDFINETLLGGGDKWADLPELADVRVERRRTGPWSPMF